MNPKRRLTIFILIFSSYVSIVVLVSAMSWSASSGVARVASSLDALYVHPYTVRSASETLYGGVFRVRACLLEITAQQLRGAVLQQKLQEIALQDGKNLEQLELSALNTNGSPSTPASGSDNGVTYVSTLTVGVWERTTYW